MRRQANYDDYIYTCYSQFGVLDQLSNYQDVGGFESWSKLSSLGPQDILQELTSSGYREQTFEQKSLKELLTSYKPSDQVIIPLHRFVPNDLLGTLYLQTPFLLIEGLGILLAALEHRKIVLLYDPDEKEIVQLLQDCLQQVRADKKLDSIVPFDSLHWQESSPHARLYTSWEIEAAFKGVFSLSPVTVMALPWIIRFGAGAYIQRFINKKAHPLLISLLGEVAKPGLYETTSELMIHDFIEIRGEGYTGGNHQFVLMLNQSFSKSMTFEKLLNLNLEAQTWSKYGYRFGLGIIECVSRGDAFRQNVMKTLIELRHNRMFKEQAEFLALNVLISFFEQNRHRPKIDSDQYTLARELAVIVKPLLSLKRLSSCYLIGEFIEHLIEFFIDDLLPEAQSS